MLPAGALNKPQPTFVRGLYGYDIDQVFCEQSHALIYRGRRKADGLPILIKLLRDPNETSWGAGWFERDYQIAQGLPTACVAKPLALERTDSGPALVYSDEGARPLEELACKEQLDIETALTICAAVAEAVSRLHKERVVHCNLNPTTVWLHEGGAGALLLDFGCAQRLSEERASKAAAYDVLLDLRYISPEQSGRIESGVDQRSDIYSIGVILFRLLTGKVPFDDPNPIHIIDGHLSRQPVFPAELPAGLGKVVSKALAKTPDARYLGASALAADLLECRALWRTTGTIGEFEPGRFDAKAMLRVPRQLYGRERETAALLEKAKSAQRGEPGMLLIKGAPGVGKSTLLSQLEAFVRKENGRFVSGKFDQYKRNVPYLALIQGMGQLVGQLLGGTKGELEFWRSRIRHRRGQQRQSGDRHHSRTGTDYRAAVAGSRFATRSGAQPLQSRVHQTYPGPRAP